MKNQPQKIYLQIGEDTDPETPFDELSEVSWCKDQIWENDLAYVPEPSWKGLLEESRVIAEKLKQERGSNYTKALSVVLEQGSPGIVAAIRAGNRAWWDSFLRDEL